jgi:putative flippase GtrA
MNDISTMLENYLKRTNSFIRFLFVGMINTLISAVVIFLLMTLLGQGYWTSTFIGNSVGIISSFLLNRSFTFASKITIKKGVFPFLMVVFLSYCFSYSLSHFSASFLWKTDRGINQEQFAVLLGMILYSMTNYIGQKRFVFQK